MRAMPLPGHLRKISTTKGPPAGYFRRAAFLYALHSDAGVISAVFAGGRKLSPSAAEAIACPARVRYRGHGRTEIRSGIPRPDQAGRGLGEILPACMAYILAMRRRDFRRGPGPSKAYGERMTWICFPCSCRRGREILPDIQTDARRKRFLGTKRDGSAECSDHPAAVMAMQEIWHVFGPPSLPEGGPRRTRRLRHGLSQNTERPCSNTCKGFRLHEILPPDVLRHGRSQAVVRRRRGEVNMLSCCLLRTLCDFQMSGLSA
jgi:hypothetical protein